MYLFLNIHVVAFDWILR